MQEVYDDLRRVAANLMRFEAPGHSLQPTALVHEAFLRAQAREGFSELDMLARKAILSQEMHRILIDHARRKKADKRGGKRAIRVSLDETIGTLSAPWIEIIALEQALVRLEAEDPQTARMIELRFFGGFTEVEIGRHLGLARRTVQKRWAWARAWLQAELHFRRRSAF